MNPRPAAALRRFGGIVFWLASASIVSAQCVPSEDLQAVLRQQPNGGTYADLGMYFGKLQQYDCAAKAFAASLQLEPEVPQVAFMLGLSLYSAGNAQDAIPPLRHAEQLGYADMNLHLVLGAAFDQVHQTAEAETEWRAALAIDPESTEALDSLSQDLIADGSNAATIALLEDPVVSGQRTPLQSLNLGLAYARTQKLDEAAGVLRDGVNNSPDSLTLNQQLAEVLLQLKRSQEATAVLDLALERHPDDLEAGLLVLRTLIGADPEKAARLAQKLLATAPHQWEVLYLNGVLETGAGNLQQARADLDESIKLNADLPMSHDVLGLVLAQLGEMRSAKEHLQQAIALGDTNPDVQSNLAKVLMSLGATDDDHESPHK